MEIDFARLPEVTVHARSQTCIEPLKVFLSGVQSAFAEPNIIYDPACSSSILFKDPSGKYGVLNNMEKTANPRDLLRSNNRDSSYLSSGKVDT